jgi:hypothetical protein
MLHIAMDFVKNFCKQDWFIKSEIQFQRFVYKQLKPATNHWNLHNSGLLLEVQKFCCSPILCSKNEIHFREQKYSSSLHMSD